MGQKISYFKNNYYKELRELLFENYSNFRQWYLDYDRSSMDQFKEPFGNERLKEYFKQDRDLQADFIKLEKEFIDELTSEFVGNYSVFSNQHNGILEFFGPTMSIWRYIESDKLISATNDKDLFELWTYITKGRSIKDRLNFDSFTNEYKIGYIDRREYLLLKSKIEFHFGDMKTIRQTFWTNKEKAELEKELSNSKGGAYSLSGHNPKSSGLEYVLEALNELTDKNKELITGIE